LTADAKGKVQKAIGKLKEKGGDKCSGQSPLFGATDPNTQATAMVAMELALIHDIFGGDLDSSLVVSDKLVAGSKDEAKCQAGIAKQVGKCANARLSSFNSCKKAGIKLDADDPGLIDSNGELEACLSADPKGKIAKDCGSKLSDAVGKCAAGLDLDALFPGCAGQDLATCVATAVQSRTDEALTTVDNLAPIGQATCDFDEDTRQCVGGPFDGQHCDDWLAHSDCRDGPGQTWRCIATARAFLARVDPNATDPAYADLNPTITFGLNGGLRINCGSIDPNTGKAPCTCALKESIQLEIGQLTTACLTPLDPNGCGIGEVDCDGDATGLSVNVISDHDIGPDVVGQGGPPFGPFGFFCGILDPNNANAECDAMCEVYCANQPGDYTKLLSGCEGFCRGGDLDGEPCELSLGAPGQDCAGPTLERSGFCVGSATHPVFHKETCGCGCIELGGGPSPAGALYCQIPILTTQILPGQTCGVHAPFVIQGRQCLPYTTEKMIATILDPNLEYGDPPIVQSDVGFGNSCEDYKANNLSGFVNVGNIPGFDGDLGDSPVEIRAACEGAAFGEPFATP
jgi:hypothetical protein